MVEMIVQYRRLAVLGLVDETDSVAIMLTICHLENVRRSTGAHDISEVRYT